MMLDDSNPNHKYTVPRNQGREAMAYLTCTLHTLKRQCACGKLNRGLMDLVIIDNYNRFPDVAVFIHGHLRSW